MADTDARIQQFVLLAKGAKGRALGELIVRATSEPGLFGFGELLALPHVQEVCVRCTCIHAQHACARVVIAQLEHVWHVQISAGHMAPFYRLLQLFCYGTWSDYAGALCSFMPAVLVGSR
jgi:COP9 signalosome complex subunit 7